MNKTLDLSHKFDSIADLLNDRYFIEMVQDQIREIKKRRNLRPLPKRGMRYKRDWYDRMFEGNMINANYFIKNIEAIWNKKSLLSSEIRNIINYYCDKALKETFKHYAKEKATEQIA